MIVATKKCGCSPPSKIQEPPCAPCCAFDKTGAVKRTSHSEYPAGVCSKKRVEKPVCRPPIQEPPPCCPIMPSEDAEFKRPEKLRSDIAEKGLPYKEIEAIINNNRVVIRTQEEITQPEYDPPCDCKEDSEPPGQKIAKEIDHSQPTGNRIVTLYPRSKQLDSDAGEENLQSLQQQAAKEVEAEGCKNAEENPNIFLLRVKNSSVSGDKRFNIDVEFKTPRPWSRQKRMELENIGKSDQVTREENAASKGPAKEKGKKNRHSKKKKKKKK